MSEHRKLRILVIDDEADWRDKLSLPLKNEGHHVQFSADRKTAHEMLKTQDFDLAIMNILLRREITDGWRLDWTNLLYEANQKETSVIVVTAMPESGLVVTKLEIYEEAIQYGVKKVFFKDRISNRQLLREVQDVVKELERHQETDRPMKESCDYRELINLFDKHLLEEEIEDIRLGLSSVCQHTAFQAAENLRGDTKREKLQYAVEVLRTYGDAHVRHLCKLVLKMKVTEQKNTNFEAAFRGLCREEWSLAETEREPSPLKPKTGEVNMVKLRSRDRQRLSEELCRLPNWRDGGLQGEKGLLRAASLPEAWINRLHLTGVSSTDAPNLIANLEDFGHLESKPTHYALGALVEHLLNATLHIEGKVFLAYLLSQYQLITNLDYLEELQREYGLLEIQKSDDVLDLGWQTQHPEFPWQGPKDPSKLEAIWSRRSPFLDAVFLEKGARVARVICRVETVESSPLGTGFLIGSHLVLTNHHVLPTDEMAESAQVRFGYRVDADGNVQLGESYRVKRALHRSPTEQLDFAVLEIEDAPGEKAQIGFLTPKAESLQVDRPLYIIQHPMGEPQKIVLQDNWITYVADDHRRVQYLTNTQSGSSGSPACNGNWEVVALHHSRSPIPSTAQTMHLRGNEGIPIMAILPKIQHLLS